MDRAPVRERRPRAVLFCPLAGARRAAVGPALLFYYVRMSWIELWRLINSYKFF